MKSIKETIEDYGKVIYLARSTNTFRTYQNALRVYVQVLEAHAINPEAPIDTLTEETVSWFAGALKTYAPATESLYLTAVVNFFEFLSAEGLATPNLLKIRQIIRLRGRRSGVRLPQFPKDDIEKVIEYASQLHLTVVDDDQVRLRNYRDRAFILTLADTGLRVHEACKLRRGNLDWRENKAIVIGKGDQEAVVRFSSRATEALREYLQKRAALDGASGKPLSTLPLFSQHPPKAQKAVKPISTRTGHAIIADRVVEVLGVEAVGTITPHSFRHYFVTTVLIGSGGNLKLAQELARHKSIAVTQRYAHLSDDALDKGYHQIFEAASDEE